MEDLYIVKLLSYESLHNRKTTRSKNSVQVEKHFYITIHLSALNNLSIFYKTAIKM